MLEQGFSLKESQFLSPAKQELILTEYYVMPGVRRLEEAGWGKEAPQDEGGGRG
jgi:hypothetical protein